MRLAMRPLGQRGDTLVEVLIAMAVVSLILGGAYVTSNRNLQATREAQERGDAIKLVESQLEQLKGLDKDVLFAGSVPASFCISGGVPVASSDDDCMLSAGGIPSSGEPPSYHIAIVRATATSTFTITNTWEGLRGANNNLEMKYRIHDE